MTGAVKMVPMVAHNKTPGTYRMLPEKSLRTLIADSRKGEHNLSTIWTLVFLRQQSHKPQSAPTLKHFPGGNSIPAMASILAPHSPLSHSVLAKNCVGFTIMVCFIILIYAENLLKMWWIVLTPCPPIALFLSDCISQSCFMYMRWM